jgi:hypothetical protein
MSFLQSKFRFKGEDTYVASPFTPKPTQKRSKPTPLPLTLRATAASYRHFIGYHNGSLSVLSVLRLRLFGCTLFVGAA